MGVGVGYGFWLGSASSAVAAGFAGAVRYGPLAVTGAARGVSQLSYAARPVVLQHWGVFEGLFFDSIQRRGAFCRCNGFS